MKNNWHDLQCVSARSTRYGPRTTKVYDTLDEAVHGVGREASLNCRQDGNFCYWLDDSGYYGSTGESEFRDDLGLLIPRGVVIAAAQSVPYRRYNNWSWWVARHPNTWAFRDGPVPHTGKRRGYGRWLRSQRHKGERRAFEAFEQEQRGIHDSFGIWVKARNRLRDINPWDNERARGDNDNHGWKSNRKTRWRDR